MSKRVSLEDREKRKAARPVSTMFQQKEEKTTIRQTYHMDAVIVEAIKIIDFETREGISNVMNRILTEAIPDDYLKQAQENLKKRQ